MDDSIATNSPVTPAPAAPDLQMDIPSPVTATPAPSPMSTVRLSGTDKAAILLMVLGEERASRILRYLDLEEAEPLMIRMAQMQNVPPEHVQVVTQEVVETAIARGYFFEGGVPLARQMLEAAYGPEKAEELIGRLQNVIETKPFKFLHRTPHEQIYNFIRREHPQLISLLLAYLPEQQSAAVLQMFDADKKTEIVKRIATMGQIAPEMLSEVESSIRAKMHTLVGSQSAPAGGIEAAATLINKVDRQAEREIFEGLAEEQPALAEEIRALLFVFEDISKLDSIAIQQIVQHADPKDLALSMRGLPDETKEVFFSNMSERAQESLREELEVMRPQRKKDVEDAQQRIVAVARRLEEQGKVQIFRGDADEVI